MQNEGRTTIVFILTLCKLEEYDFFYEWIICHQYRLLFGKELPVPPLKRKHWHLFSLGKRFVTGVEHLIRNITYQTREGEYWQVVNHFATCKRSQEVEPGSKRKTAPASSQREDLNPRPPEFKSYGLTTRPG